MLVLSCTRCIILHCQYQALCLDQRLSFIRMDSWLSDSKVEVPEWGSSLNHVEMPAGQRIKKKRKRHQHVKVGDSDGVASKDAHLAHSPRPVSGMTNAGSKVHSKKTKKRRKERSVGRSEELVGNLLRAPELHSTDAKVVGEDSRPLHGGREVPIPSGQAAVSSHLHQKRKSKKKRTRKKVSTGLALEVKGSPAGESSPKRAASVPVQAPFAFQDLIPPVSSASSFSMSKLQAKMTRKLDGARFRWINEQLYTRSSADAQSLLDSDPSLFAVYHEGFRSQAEHWPINPVDIIAKNIAEHCSEHDVVGDFGCGDAALAFSLPHYTVHSFDLVAVNDRVTACDIAHVPLPNKALDIAVFSLSLMGTNFVDFLVEANRTLKVGGLLKIAEITSRFTNLDRFISLLHELGFDLVRKSDLKLMALLDLKKSSRKMVLPRKHAGGASALLKPCVYKKR